MGQRGVLRTMGDGLVGFWCPGCQGIHAINIDTTDRPEYPAWDFNGDYDKPTFSPSIKISRTTHVPPVTAENFDEWKRAPWPQKAVAVICHSHVANGAIEFCPDTTHALAGKTVPLEVKEI